MLTERKWRKGWKTVFAWLFVIMYIITSIPAQSLVPVSAAQSDYQFDFGANGTQSGFIGVSASEGYDSAKGYGFNTPSNMADVAASGSGELSDAVQFKSTDGSNTFNVDLPNGLYEITVYLGNTMRTSIWAEDCMQVVNMTGDNATHTWQMPVTDGQLNIRATAGKEGYAFTMSSLIIKKLSDDPKMSQTVWICGDSTVCNYYPLDTSVQGGWGQMLDQYIDTNKWQVRNMAASGQYAKGFVDAGQFTPILKYGKSGDIYIISIGINDTNYSNREEYHDTVYDMAQQAMEKGMKVVLVKQQGRADDISRSTLLTGRWFSDQLDVVGEELGVQVVDLFNLAQDYYLSIGQDAVYNLYMSGDTLHPNREGAKVLARLMSEQIDFAGIKETVDGSRYYAVDASYENAIFENYNLGYAGRGYVNFDNMVGSNITFEVDVEEAGNYLVTFRVANGSVNDRAMKIEVNDGTDYWIQSFTSTGSYTTWEDRGIVLPLNAGTNKIKATATMSEGGPNFDYIELEKTDEPIAETYQPEQTTEAPAVTRKTTVYIAGDSTAQSYRASYAPQQGWGYYLQNHLGDGVTVSNHAIAGRSSKSFYDNGRLTTILNEIQQGDYLLVQFGINDSSSLEERSAPVCGSVDNATDGSFEYYMKMYIQGALDKGAIPVLISPTLGLKAYSNGSFVNSYTNYADAMRNLSNYYNVPFIDMNSLMVQNYNSVGYDAAKLYHLYGVVEGSTDMTHFSEAGADNAARLLAEPLKNVIAQYTPTTEAPTTEAPTTEVPTTQAPTTEVPTTQAPTTEIMTTEEPATELITTEAPTIEIPTTEEATMAVSTTEELTTEVPATDDTTMPSTEGPVADITTESAIPELTTTQTITADVNTTEYITQEVPTTQGIITTEWYPVTTELYSSEEVTTEDSSGNQTTAEPQLTTSGCPNTEDNVTTENNGVATTEANGYGDTTQADGTTSGCPNTTEDRTTSWNPGVSEGDSTTQDNNTGWNPGVSEGDNTTEDSNTSWNPGVSEGDNTTENSNTSWNPGVSEGDNTTENSNTSWNPGASEGDNTTENSNTSWNPGASEGDNTTQNSNTSWNPGASEGDNTTENSNTSWNPGVSEGDNTTENSNTSWNPGVSEGDNTTQNSNTSWYPGVSEGDNTTENSNTSWYPGVSEGDSTTQDSNTGWYPGVSEGDNTTQDSSTSWYPGVSEGDNTTQDSNTSWYPGVSEGDNTTQDSNTGWNPGASEGDSTTQDNNTSWNPGVSEGDSTTQDSNTGWYPGTNEDNTTTENNTMQNSPTASATTQTVQQTQPAGTNSSVATTQDTQPTTQQNQNADASDFAAGDVLTISWLNAVIQFNTVNASGGTVTYVKPVTAAKEIVIPNTICINNKVYKVTAIGEKAFANCKKLQKVTIGSKVVKIGKKAFYKCKNLKKVVIKTKKLKKSTVGKQAFKGISKKVVIKVPKGKKKLYKKIIK